MQKNVTSQMEEAKKTQKEPNIHIHSHSEIDEEIPKQERIKEWSKQHSNREI